MQFVLAVSALLTILFGYPLVLKIIMVLLGLIIGFMAVSFIPAIYKKWFQSIKKRNILWFSSWVCCGILFDDCVRLFYA